MLCLVLISIMSTASLAGLDRTRNQSQLAAALTRQALLQAEARQTLIEAARLADSDGKKYAQLEAAGCPERCDWSEAWRADTDKDVNAAYIVQRLAPGKNHFMISVRATHRAGGEFVTHGLFNANTDRFHFVR